MDDIKAPVTGDGEGERIPVLVLEEGFYYVVGQGQQLYAHPRTTVWINGRDAYKAILLDKAAVVKGYEPTREDLINAAPDAVEMIRLWTTHGGGSQDDPLAWVSRPAARRQLEALALRLDVIKSGKGKIASGVIEGRNETNGSNEAKGSGPQTAA